MRAKQGGFWLGFFLTLAVLLPLSALFLLQSSWQNRPQQTAESQPDVPVVAGARNVQTFLLAVAAEQPGFLLVRLDCPARSVRMLALPGESVLLTDDGTATLAESYRAAGPARAAALLEKTLTVQLGGYLAATPAGYDVLLNGAAARVDTSALLTSAQRKALNLTDPVLELTAETAGQLLATAFAAGVNGAPLAGLRAGVWEAFFRQNLGVLPGVPQAMRQNAGQLLTNLTAGQLLSLEDTLEYLSGQSVTAESGVLAGSWAARTDRYEFNAESQRQAQALLEG